MTLEFDNLIYYDDYKIPKSTLTASDLVGLGA
jgi:hypothetical protein